LQNNPDNRRSRKPFDLEKKHIIRFSKQQTRSVHTLMVEMYAELNEPSNGLCGLICSQEVSQVRILLPASLEKDGTENTFNLSMLFPHNSQTDPQRSSSIFSMFMVAIYSLVN